MRLTDKRSKLVATIGPASSKYETLKELILNGVTCVRANFSHGTHEDHAKKFELARKISKELDIPISLMLDTKGPEIRIGKMKDDACTIPAGAVVKVWTDAEIHKNHIGTESEISVEYAMNKDLKVGDIVLFDDGKLITKVVEVGSNFVNVKAENTHKLKTTKRINLPGVEFSLPFLAKKDIEDIKFGIKIGVDYIAASFVNSAKNVNELRELLNKNNASHIKIISKIESSLGIKNINEIIEASDGIMIARGDLGLEIPYYDVPYFEKMMIRKCREAGKPVIVATQMLDSMENTPHPTRAEVTDVYLATELGADSTMLSGETASGNYPIESVKTMSTINKRAEKEFYNEKYYDIQLEEVRRKSDSANKRSRIAYEVANRVRYGDYKFTVVLSRTGKLLEEVAKFRPNVTIIGILDNNKLVNSFGITSSVWTSLSSATFFSLIKKNHENANKALIPYGAEIGDRYLVVENEVMTEHIIK